MVMVAEFSGMEECRMLVNWDNHNLAMETADVVQEEGVVATLKYVECERVRFLFVHTLEHQLRHHVCEQIPTMGPDL